MGFVLPKWTHIFFTKIGVAMILIVGLTSRDIYRLVGGFNPSQKY